MSQSLQLKVNNWKKHRLCSEHGARYLMLPDFNHPGQTGLCAHPTCLEKMVRATGSYPLCGPLVRFCIKLDKDAGHPQGFFEFVVEKLLLGAKKGQPTVMNPTFMRFAALNYLNLLRRADKKAAAERELMDQINEILENEAMGSIEDMEAVMIAPLGCGRGAEWLGNPERIIATKEIIQMTIAEWGVEVYLWLWGELSDLDFQKITKKQAKELPEIRKSYRKWYKDIVRG